MEATLFHLNPRPRAGPGGGSQGVRVHAEGW